MGPSALHGAIATLIGLAIMAVGHKSYTFNVLTKMWLGIVLFGLFHTFVFMPTIFSLLGPATDAKRKKSTRRKVFFQKIESMNDS